MELTFATSIKLLCLSSRGGPDWNESKEVFEHDGPIPRLFKDKLRGDIEEVGIKHWRAERDKAINRLTHQKLKAVLDAIDSSAGIDGTGDISHKLFLIRRKDLDEPWVDVVNIITRDVEQKLLKNLIKMKRDELVDLYRMTSVAPFTRKAAGVFFEAFCLKHMEHHGLHLRLLKMVRLPNKQRNQDSTTETNKKRNQDSTTETNRKRKQDSTTEINPQFHSSHMEITNSELEKGRQIVAGMPEGVDINLEDLKIEYFKSGGNGQLKENTLYIPESPNAESLDAFFLHKLCLYILQFTIAETHSIKSLGGLSGYTGCPEKKDWKFVFVIDGSHILKVPSREYGFDLYSAIVRPDTKSFM